eukprot:10834648-Alexandrium_andersonii.AAC.1
MSEGCTGMHMHSSPNQEGTTLRLRACIPNGSCQVLESRPVPDSDRDHNVLRHNQMSMASCVHARVSSVNEHAHVSASVA